MTGMNRAALGKCIAGLVFFALALGLVEAQFHLLKGLFGPGPLTQRELAMEYLGRYLAGQYGGERAVVLGNPFSLKSGQPKEVYQFEKAGLQGLKRGFGKSILIEAVAFPEVTPGFVENPRSVFIDPSTTTPLSYIVADDALDKITAAHPQAGLLVSLIGLPLHVRQTATWKSAQRRKFALLLPDLRMVGDETAVREAVLEGKIVAFVLNKPGAPPESQPLGKDSKMEFDRRFLLVNRETIDRLLQLYPRLLR
jgi:hypothetical protein